jgi:hypothetical protein
VVAIGNASGRDIDNSQNLARPHTDEKAEAPLIAAHAGHKGMELDKLPIGENSKILAASSAEICN